ncbi:16S rRNA (cytosine(1402)-N(4))-methyltransferase RsmH [Halochromatium salexigens]|uniref:Ribosomal RNA small subunit methyltransferase H n=1 Tax=Halochromatium salexigens TaxID=49447 RepID=A0AAJ0UI18_HALSE|nr:16S rRNA (cytosine(1402)-N(4))-methyltransferase RsmH [Halochromatium salexigens]MBK5930907.1 16S rRNA (cytosine(1402)-N(4))-methyltransferase [Halochromatium salexigens]
MASHEHVPVLLEESMQALAISTHGRYLDGTFGRGGHARALLARLGPAGRLLAVDRDPEALAAGQALAASDPRLEVEQVRYSQLPALARARGWTGRIDGLLLDLGVSSPQLDQPARGFSFHADAPLDMRMDPSSGQSAADWLASASEQAIASVLKELGEERFARRIARAIVAARQQQPLTTTGQLAALIERAVPTREPGKHPATRSFQAIRIQINGELDELRSALAGVCDLLASGGRLVVISFHSLEDRLVKRFIRDEAQGANIPKGVPVRDAELCRRLRIIGSPVRPSAAEIERNPRARSAVLRAAERLP